MFPVRHVRDREVEVVISDATVRLECTWEFLSRIERERR